MKVTTLREALENDQAMASQAAALETGHFSVAQRIRSGQNDTDSSESMTGAWSHERSQ